MIQLYFKLIGASIRSQMQYKLSFVLDILGFLLLTGLEFAVAAILVARFGTVAGWSVAEVALLYGLTAVAFSLSEMIMRGFDAPFSRMMQQGTFDTLLIRPLPAFFQVLASHFQLRRLGRTLQGAIALGFAYATLPIEWTPARLALLPITMVAGGLIYGGITLIGATVCFWTIKSPEVVNVFTSGGTTMVSYPLSIYSAWMRAVFLWVVPVAFVNYPAALLLLNRTDPDGLPAQLAWASPLVAALFFAVALLFWCVGVSKYQGAGS
jgi:ABC-2 type transport system permease protein